MTVSGADAATRTVAVVFGGRSSEHEISCVTAASVVAAIDREKFDIVLVGITKSGETVLVDESTLRSFGLDAPHLPEIRPNGTRVLWPQGAESRELLILEGDSIRHFSDIDVVMPLLHGQWGEDGTIQGMLELLGLPYVGSGVLASALCMDKHLVKSVLQDAGIAVAPWHSVTRAAWKADRGALARSLDAGLRYPLFVKPARAGSSVGVSRVDSQADLAGAIDEALAEDAVALIEQGVEGRELELGVLEGCGGREPRVSRVAGEIVCDEGVFYDYDTKYLGASGVELRLPADLTGRELEQVQQLARRAFEVAHCAGLARVDVFLTESGPVVNEINTMPGFTPISMYPRLWEASGLSYAELITELLELAGENGDRRR